MIIALSSDVQPGFGLSTICRASASLPPLVASATCARASHAAEAVPAAKNASSDAPTKIFSFMTLPSHSIPKYGSNGRPPIGG
ncbi:hypothetical protein LP421_09475 [Rhizobium sp. RCAM05350]|nr:hypothetical protein LP421_09475 [Rhizobium sp. RCAM05350]